MRINKQDNTGQMKGDEHKRGQILSEEQEQLREVW